MGSMTSPAQPLHAVLPSPRRALNRQAMTSSELSGATAESSADLRIVLLGRTGSGISSTGNRILGSAAFPVDVSPLSVTQQCTRACGVVEGRSLWVMDTPGFFHTCMSGGDVCAELARGLMELVAPGPHILLLVLEVGRFTAEQRATVDWIGNVLGSEALKHTMLVLTHTERLQQKPAESFLCQSEELWEFLRLCDGRVHALDRTNPEDGVELVRKMEAMMEKNGRTWYPCEERVLGMKEERKMREEEMSEKERRKKAEREFWCELVTSMGKGALESSGIMEIGKGRGKKSKIVHRVAAIATTPLTISSTAKIVGGAMKEGGKVLFKHKKSLLQ